MDDQRSLEPTSHGGDPHQPPLHAGETNKESVEIIQEDHSGDPVPLSHGTGKAPVDARDDGAPREGEYGGHSLSPPAGVGTHHGSAPLQYPFSGAPYFRYVTPWYPSVVQQRQQRWSWPGPMHGYPHLPPGAGEDVSSPSVLLRSQVLPPFCTKSHTSSGVPSGIAATGNDDESDPLPETSTKEFPSDPSLAHRNSQVVFHLGAASESSPSPSAFVRQRSRSAVLPTRQESESVLWRTPAPVVESFISPLHRAPSGWPYSAVASSYGLTHQASNRCYPPAPLASPPGWPSAPHRMTSHGWLPTYMWMPVPPSHCMSSNDRAVVRSMPFVHWNVSGGLVGGDTFANTSWWHAPMPASPGSPVRPPLLHAPPPLQASTDDDQVLPETATSPDSVHCASPPGRGAAADGAQLPPRESILVQRSSFQRRTSPQSSLPSRTVGAVVPDATVGGSYVTAPLPPSTESIMNHVSSFRRPSVLLRSGVLGGPVGGDIRGRGPPSYSGSVNFDAEDPSTPRQQRREEVKALTNKSPLPQHQEEVEEQQQPGTSSNLSLRSVYAGDHLEALHAEFSAEGLTRNSVTKGASLPSHLPSSSLVAFLTSERRWTTAEAAESLPSTRRSRRGRLSPDQKANSPKAVATSACAALPAVVEAHEVGGKALSTIEQKTASMPSAKDDISLSKKVSPTPCAGTEEAGTPKLAHTLRREVAGVGDAAAVSASQDCLGLMTTQPRHRSPTLLLCKPGKLHTCAKSQTEEEGEKEAPSTVSIAGRKIRFLRGPPGAAAQAEYLVDELIKYRWTTTPTESSLIERVTEVLLAGYSASLLSLDANGLVAPRSAFSSPTWQTTHQLLLDVVHRVAKMRLIYGDKERGTEGSGISAVFSFALVKKKSASVAAAERKRMGPAERPQPSHEVIDLLRPTAGGAPLQMYRCALSGDRLDGVEYRQVCSETEFLAVFEEARLHANAVLDRLAAAAASTPVSKAALEEQASVFQVVTCVLTHRMSGAVSLQSQLLENPALVRERLPLEDVVSSDDDGSDFKAFRLHNALNSNSDVVVSRLTCIGVQNQHHLWRAALADNEDAVPSALLSSALGAPVFSVVLASINSDGHEAAAVLKTQLLMSTKLHPRPLNGSAQRRIRSSKYLMAEAHNKAHDLESSAEAGQGEEGADVRHHAEVLLSVEKLIASLDEAS